MIFHSENANLVQGKNIHNGFLKNADVTIVKSKELSRKQRKPGKKPEEKEPVRIKEKGLRYQM